MQVTVSSPPIIFVITFAAKSRFPENGSLLLIGQFEERNAQQESEQPLVGRIVA